MLTFPFRNPPERNPASLVERCRAETAARAADADAWLPGSHAPAWRDRRRRLSPVVPPGRSPDVSTAWSERSSTRWLTALDLIGSPWLPISPDLTSGGWWDIATLLFGNHSAEAAVICRTSALSSMGGVTSCQV